MIKFLDTATGTVVYLDGRPFLYFNHKLSEPEKKSLKTHPFQMFKPMKS